MKTPARTTLPDNPYEQPVYEMKRSIFFGWGIYFAAATVPIINCYLWWLLCFDPLTRFTAQPGALAVLVAVSLVCVLWVAIMIAAGDVYFYERYVEIRRFLPFMKQRIIYYDKMYIHIPMPMHTEYYENMDIHMPLPTYISLQSL